MLDTQLDTQNVTFLLEASGDTLTVGDFRLKAGLVEELPNVNGKAIRSGSVERIRAVGSDTNAAKGSFSVYAGLEKIGTLNWDCSDPAGHTDVDWTPLSQNYSTKVSGDPSVAEATGEVRLKVSKRAGLNDKRTNLAASTVGLGLAGF